MELPINLLAELSKQIYTTTVNWQKTKAFGLQTRMEFVRFHKDLVPAEVGYLISQDVDYSPASSKLSGNLRLAYFHSQGYDSRMYAYEDDVLYSIAFGMYNSRGWRTYLNLKYKIAKKIDLWCRCALFFYPGSNLIGSGLDEIIGNTKTDVKLQMRIQF